jgi:hypothetical protein
MVFAGMPAPKRRESDEIIRVSRRRPDGTTEDLEFRNPSPHTVREILHSHRKAEYLLAGDGDSRPSGPNPPGPQAEPPDALDRERAPTWQVIRNWILSLDERSGFEHSTADLQKKFFGRQLAFVEGPDKRLAKTTGTNHRKAKAAIEKDLGGEFVGHDVGARRQHGTTLWRLRKD